MKALIKKGAKSGDKVKGYVKKTPLIAPKKGKTC